MIVIFLNSNSYNYPNDNIARLVPLYHSLGTVRDTFVVPFVAVAGTGTKCVIWPSSRDASQSWLHTGKRHLSLILTYLFFLFRNDGPSRLT